jgi:hypothetical protein
VNNYIVQAIGDKDQYGDKAPKPKLYGNYRVETFYKDSIVIPPLATDKARWNKIILSDVNRCAIQMMDDSLCAYAYHVNSDSSEIRFMDRNSSQLKYTFKYLETDKDHIELKSEDPDGSIYMKLARLKPDAYLLMNRGFHWINEYPLNR